MIKGVKVIERIRLSDERGWFIKAIDGAEDGLPKYTGEIYVTTAIPNQSKGGDYSLIANKWFTIINGRADLLLEDIETHERMSIILDSNTPKTVFVPCKVANIFINNYDIDFILLVYADQKYDKNDMVTYKL